MALDVGTIKGGIDFDTSDWKAAQREVKTGAEKMGTEAQNAGKKMGKAWGEGTNKLKGTIKQLAAGVVGFMALQKAISSVSNFMKSSVKAANEHEAAIKQLETVLKSTGGAAGLTKEELLGLATGMEEVTTYSDDAVIGAENILLTFTKLGKETFPDALEVVLDMSTALGQDLKSSSIQVGKALQDPILGVTALRRVGVNFNEAQTDVIKNMVNTGNAAGAQALILKELQTEFGGSARAASETFGGALEQLGNTWGNVKKEVGGAITQNQDFKDGIKGITDWLKEHKADIALFFDTLIKGAIGAAKFLGKVVSAVDSLTLGIGKTNREWREYANAQTDATRVMREGENIVTFMKKAVDAGATSVLEMINLQKQYGGDSEAVFNAIANGEAGEELKTFYDSLVQKNKDVKKKADEAATALRNQPSAMTTVTTAIATATPQIDGIIVKTGNWKTAVEDVIDVLELAPSYLNSFVYQIGIPAARDLSDVWQQAPVDIESKWEEFKIEQPKKAEAVKSAWITASERIRDKWTTELGAMLSGATSLKEGLGAIWTEIKQQFFDLVAQMITKWVLNFANKMVSSMADAGKDVISGIGDLAKSAADTITSLSPTGLIAGLAGGVIAGIGSLVGAGQTVGAIDATNRELHNIWIAVHETRDFLFIDVRKELLQNMQLKQSYNLDKLDAQTSLLDRMWKEDKVFQPDSISIMEGIRGYTKKTWEELKALPHAQHGMKISEPSLVMTGENAPRVPEYIIPEPVLNNMMMNPGASPRNSVPSKIQIIVDNQIQQEIDMIQPMEKIMIKSIPEMSRKGKLKIHSSAVGRDI